MHLRNGEHGYGAVTKALHWLTVAAIAAQFFVGYTMETEGDVPEVDCDPPGDDRARRRPVRCGVRPVGPAGGGVRGGPGPAGGRGRRHGRDGVVGSPLGRPGRGRAVAARGPRAPRHHHHRAGRPAGPVASDRSASALGPAPDRTRPATRPRHRDDAADASVPGPGHRPAAGSRRRRPPVAPHRGAHRLLRCLGSTPHHGPGQGAAPPDAARPSAPDGGRGAGPSPTPRALVPAILRRCAR